MVREVVDDDVDDLVVERRESLLVQIVVERFRLVRVCVRRFNEHKLVHWGCTVCMSAQDTTERGQGGSRMMGTCLIELVQADLEDV